MPFSAAGRAVFANLHGSTEPLSQETKFRLATAGCERPHLAFTVFCAGFIVSIAALALVAPVGIKVLAVLLFAGPHNWIELRYFLSRLPARWSAGVSLFFGTSFTGLTLLGATYIGLLFALFQNALPWDVAHDLYRLWGLSACTWAWILFLQMAKLPAARVGSASLGAATVLFLLLGSLAVTQPTIFGVALVYLHPLVSLAILDRELSRSKPHWHRGFRMCLALIPLTIGVFWWHLHAIQISINGAAASHIMQQTGASVMPFASNYFLLSTLVFLDLLHYAVWLIAIPNWSAGWTKWHPRSIPVVCRFPRLRSPITLLVALASGLVVVLWCAFSSDYVATSQVYFVIAIMHVLAEIPFLIWASR